MGETGIYHDLCAICFNPEWPNDLVHACVDVASRTNMKAQPLLEQQALSKFPSTSPLAGLCDQSRQSRNGTVREQGQG